MGAATPKGSYQCSSLVKNGGLADAVETGPFTDRHLPGCGWNFIMGGDLP